MAAVATPAYTKVFSAASLVLKLDTNLALFLLPHMVYNLLDNEKHRNTVRAEIMQVFGAGGSSSADTEWQLCVQVTVCQMCVSSSGFLSFSTHEILDSASIYLVF